MPSTGWECLSYWKICHRSDAEIRDGTSRGSTHSQPTDGKMPSDLRAGSGSSKCWESLRLPNYSPQNFTFSNVFLTISRSQNAVFYMAPIPSPPIPVLVTLEPQTAALCPECHQATKAPPHFTFRMRRTNELTPLNKLWNLRGLRWCRWTGQPHGLDGPMPPLPRPAAACGSIAGRQWLLQPVPRGLAVAPKKTWFASWFALVKYDFLQRIS